MFQYKQNKESNEVLKKQERLIINKLSTQLRNDLMLDIQGKYLNNIPLFKNLKEKDKISNIMEEYLFSPGELIFKQGDTGDCSLFYIVKGSVQILFLNDSCQKKDDTVIAVKNKQEYFGEISFITGNPRSLSAKANDFCRVYKINREKFDEIIKQNDYDHENFQMQKEAIFFNNNYKFCSIKCLICNQGNHYSVHCPRSHFTLAKQVVISRHNHSIPCIDRQYFMRGRRKLNYILQLKKLQEDLIEINKHESLFEILDEIELGFNFIEITDEDEDQQLLQQMNQQDNENNSRYHDSSHRKTIQEGNKLSILRSFDSNRMSKHLRESNLQNEEISQLPELQKKNSSRQIILGDRQQSNKIRSGTQIESQNKHSQNKSSLSQPINITKTSSSSQSSSQSSSKSSSSSQSSSRSSSNSSIENKKSQKNQNKQSISRQSNSPSKSPNDKIKQVNRFNYDFINNNDDQHKFLNNGQVLNQKNENEKNNEQFNFPQNVFYQNKTPQQKTMNVEEQHEENDKNNIIGQQQIPSLQKIIDKRENTKEIFDNQISYKSQKSNEIKQINPLHFQKNSNLQPEPFKSTFQIQERRTKINSQQQIVPQRGTRQKVNIGDSINLIQQSVMQFLNQQQGKKIKANNENNIDLSNLKHLEQISQPFGLKLGEKIYQENTRITAFHSQLIPEDGVNDKPNQIGIKHEVIESPEQTNYFLLTIFEKAKTFKYYLPHNNYLEVIKSWQVYKQKTDAKFARMRMRGSIFKKKGRTNQSKRKVQDQ